MLQVIFIHYFTYNDFTNNFTIEPNRIFMKAQNKKQKNSSRHPTLTPKKGTQTLKKSTKYWLMKSEPSVYSIYDLQKSGKDLWDGVRNYQARNFMKCNMTPGDQVLFYHSNANPPGVAGLAYVSKSAQPDPSAFDPNSKYYDPQSTPKNPRWFCVEVAFKALFKHFISLEELKKHKKLLNFPVLKKGQRLSVMPITKNHYEYIVFLSKTKPSIKSAIKPLVKPLAKSTSLS